MNHNPKTQAVQRRISFALIIWRKKICQDILKTKSGKLLWHRKNTSAGVECLLVRRSNGRENNIATSYLGDKFRRIFTRTTYALHRSFYHSRDLYLIRKTEIIRNRSICAIFAHKRTSSIGSGTKNIWADIQYISRGTIITYPIIISIKIWRKNDGELCICGITRCIMHSKRYSIYPFPRKYVKWIFVSGSSPIRKIPMITIVPISSDSIRKKRHRNINGSIKSGGGCCEWVAHITNLNRESGVFYRNLLICGRTMTDCISDNKLYQP